MSLAGHDQRQGVQAPGDPAPVVQVPVQCQALFEQRARCGVLPLRRLKLPEAEQRRGDPAFVPQFLPDGLFNWKSFLNSARNER